MKLFERERELGVLERVLDEGGLLVIEGPAGIGKSSLLQVAVHRQSDRGSRVASARGAPLETNHPFGVARQLFEPLLRGSERERLLAGTAAAAVPAVDPTLLQIAPDAAEFLVLRGLAALAVNLAERGQLLLVVDDAQWADLPSLRFITFLARRLDGPDITLAAGIRSGENGAGRQVLDELRSLPEARVIRPRPLSARATAELVRNHAPSADAEACARCYEAAGGNPLLVTEIAGALATGQDLMAAASSGIGEGVRRRVARAHRSAPAVAAAAAVLGDGATLARVSAVADVEAEIAARAVGALVGADVLRTPEPYTFVHPLVQAAVLDTLDIGDRIALHRAAADVLAAHGAPIEQVAAQLLALPGTGDARVVASLRVAAATALNRGAVQPAVVLLRRALSEPPPSPERCDVLRELATAERLAGEEAAVIHLQLAQDLATDARERVSLARDLAMTQYDLSRYEDAAQTLSIALREAPEDLDPAARDALRVDLLTVALQASSVDVATLQNDLSRGSEPADPAVSTAYRIASLAMALTEGPVDGTATELEQLLRVTPPAPERLDLHTPLWFGLILYERFDAVREMLDAVEADGPGWMRRQFALNLARARLQHRLGDLPGALATHEANLEFGFDNHTGVLFTRAGLASVCVDLGDVERALAVITADDVPASRTEAHLCWIHWAIGRACVAAGDDEGAARAFDAGCAIQRAFPNDHGCVWEEGAADRIACYWRLGRQDEARRETAKALAVARRTGLRGLEGIAHRLVGLIDGNTASLETSARLLGATPLRLELARSLCEHGSALRRLGRRTEARGSLRQALDLAHACGARPLAARAREELTLAGARPRRDAQTGRDALTAAERRVAQRAARGATNREIAQALFITNKTVEGHLAHAFRKLNVHRREELAAALTATETT